MTQPVLDILRNSLVCRSCSRMELVKTSGLTMQQIVPEERLSVLQVAYRDAQDSLDRERIADIAKSMDVSRGEIRALKQGSLFAGTPGIPSEHESFIVGARWELEGMRREATRLVSDLIRSRTLYGEFRQWVRNEQ